MLTRGRLSGARAIPSWRIHGGTTLSRLFASSAHHRLRRDARCRRLRLGPGAGGARLHQHRRVIHGVSVRDGRRGAVRPPQRELQDARRSSRPGSGGGIKRSAAASASSYPDIANSSRRITASEVADCAKNGVSGDRRGGRSAIDGIVLANAKASPHYQADCCARSISRSRSRFPTRPARRSSCRTPIRSGRK